MESQDPRAARFSRLLESGMPKEDAWKLIAVEILADAGIVVPEQLEPSRETTATETVQIPIFESKLLKVIRMEPEQEKRVRALLKIARDEAAAARQDLPSESSVIRRALSLGLDELEKQRRRRV